MQEKRTPKHFKEIISNLSIFNTLSDEHFDIIELCRQLKTFNPAGQFGDSLVFRQLLNSKRTVGYRCGFRNVKQIPYRLHAELTVKK